MNFFCVKGQSLELRILGYEYPDEIINKDDHNWFKDSNWLMIFIKGRSVKLRWEATAPVLNIYDVKYLIDWFNDLSNNKTVEHEIVDSIEPEETFKTIERGRRSMKAAVGCGNRRGGNDVYTTIETYAIYIERYKTHHRF